MQFLVIVAPASDLHIDVDNFANTDSGKLIQAAINLGWGIVVGNDNPIERVVTEYIRDRGGDVFSTVATGGTDTVWTHIIPDDCLV